VQIAAFDGSDAVVIGGLQPGDRVIVDNLIKARPGAPVQVRGEAPPPADAHG
jgi:membrane fusion protein, multidrug efflux system